MDALLKMLLPSLGLTPEKVKTIIDDIRLTANSYAADIAAIKSDLAAIKDHIATHNKD